MVYPSNNNAASGQYHHVRTPSTTKPDIKREKKADLEVKVQDAVGAPLRTSSEDNAFPVKKSPMKLLKNPAHLREIIYAKIHQLSQKGLSEDEILKWFEIDHVDLCQQLEKKNADLTERLEQESQEITALKEQNKILKERIKKLQPNQQAEKIANQIETSVAPHLQNQEVQRNLASPVKETTLPQIAQAELHPTVDKDTKPITASILDIYNPEERQEAICEKAHIPTKNEVLGLFKAVCTLQGNVAIERKNLENQDPNEMRATFVDLLNKTKTLTIKYKNLKSYLKKDITTIQQKIVEDTVVPFSKEHCKGTEIISRGDYSEKKCTEDLRRHSKEHDQMKNELNKVLNHDTEIWRRLTNIIYNIDIAIGDVETFKGQKIDDTFLEISSTLNALSLDIQAIIIPEVKENVLDEGFDYLYNAMISFATFAREQRKVWELQVIPSDPAVKAKHMEKLKHLYNYNKKSLRALEKLWNYFKPHHNIRMTELKEKVAIRSRNIDLEYIGALDTVADIEHTTANEYKVNKISPHITEHDKNRKTLTALEKRLQNFLKTIGEGQQEGHRSYDAYMKEGKWTTETEWWLKGWRDPEIKTFFSAEPIPLEPDTTEPDPTEPDLSNADSTGPAKQESPSQGWFTWFF